MAKILTVTEASKKYGITTGYLRRLLLQQQLKGRKSGGVWLIEEGSLQRYFARRKIKRKKLLTK